MSSKETRRIEVPEHLRHHEEVALRSTVNGQARDFTPADLSNAREAFIRTARTILESPSETDAVQGFIINQDEEDSNHYSFRYQRPNYLEHADPEIFEPAAAYLDGPRLTGEVRVSSDWKEIVLYDASVTDA